MFKCTRKDINGMYRNVYKVGYCDLQTLLRNVREVGYNSGVYGWNWTAYELDADTVIVTGYRNLTGDRIDGEIIREYESRAKQIEKDASWEDRSRLIDELLDEFKEAIK